MTIFSRLKEPKIYAGQDQLIYRSVLTGNVTDLTISGLDGATDKMYRLECMWNGGGQNFATIQCNADATAANYRTQGMGSIANANYAAYNVSTAGMAFNYGSNAGDTSEVKIFAKAGYKMISTKSSGLGTVKMVWNAGIWLDTSNLTSIKLVALPGYATTLTTPVMTSNTAPSGVCSGSEELRAAYKAFNQTNADANDSWASNGTLPAWLKYDFGAGNEKIITKLKVVTCNYAPYPYAPGAWKFQGSNNNTDWTDLLTGTNSTNTANTTIIDTAVTNSTAYRYYRLYITTACRNPYVNVGEMYMYSDTTGYFNTGSEFRLYANKSGA